MLPAFQLVDLVALAVRGFFRVGTLRLPVFGLIATAGVLAALALGQRTAAAAGVDPARLWDAGIVAIASAFLASRLLLALAHPRLLRAHPLWLLAQPSLPVGGLALAGLFVWLWLRHRRLPLRRVLDGWAAPAALLAAILQLAHFAEGTDAGMPTTLFWGVHLPGDPASPRLHPVQLYAAAAYLSLCMYLLRRAREHATSTAESNRDLAPLLTPGHTAALGLLLGGVLSFCLGFFRQPYDPSGHSWLDPVQWAALAAMVSGSAVWSTRPRPSTEVVPAAVKSLPSQAADSTRDVPA